MLALGIRYLTGYAVATDVSSRERAEWPPHPARVFMALAAAHFETGGDADERTALAWLERQGSPALKVSEAQRRDVVTCYVPVNDSSDPVKGKKALTPLQSVALGRDRQPRTFPRVRLDDEIVLLVWPDAAPESPTRITLDRLCRKVVRIGHSSSLVQMWVEDHPPPANWEPDDLGEHPMRIVSQGVLTMLTSAYNRDSIEAWADLQERIANAKGKTKAALKKELLERFGNGEPRTVRPTISRWQAYRQAGAARAALPAVSGVFDRNLLVLSIEEGPVVGLETAWQLMTALRDTILVKCDPTPEWLSGHQPDGSPSQDPHVALLPLPFVGHEHADGHLLGIALAFPNAIATRERGRALRGLLYDNTGQVRLIELQLGSLGAWTLVRETRPSPPFSLQSNRWTSPSYTWATVTPIVLDRHPKTDRAKDRQRWSLEVAEAIAESCERQGLPKPVEIDIDKTSWFHGAPRAVAGKGSGFPLMPVKRSQPARQQVHAWLRFDQLIEGPLLLGAGRYRGYGACGPWKEQRR